MALIYNSPSGRVSVVSPTPIRPLSPSRDCSFLNPVFHFTVEHVKLDSGSEDEEAEMELGREIFHILQGSPVTPTFGQNFQPPYGAENYVKPPSRNQNPLIKDQRFEVDHDFVSQDRDVQTSKSFLMEAQCFDGMRGSRCFPQSEITVG